MEIYKAIKSLKPNVSFSMEGDDIVTWESDLAQPTTEEINAEVIRLQAVYDAKAYSRSRAKEYPSIADQLDDIYHNGIDAWKVTIKAIKDKYPKE